MHSNLNHKNSELIFQQSCNILAGGVNSPVRSFKNVNQTPVIIDRGQGKYIFDVDDNKYIDFVNSWGALILGHAHTDAVNAVKNQAERGFSFGAATELELKLAELIKSCIPSLESMRMVSTGTEACMSAIRLARGFTKKNKIIKFIGHYHGHSDPLLSQAGSGLLTHSLPDSAGVPKEFVSHTINVEFNNTEALNKVFSNFSDDIAAVIVEPIAANMNLVEPKPSFLEFLRDICNQNNSLLIFDEVITGFRVALGGAQSLYNITPDLTCLGKIVGGGLPAAVFGGRKDIMQCLAPTGPVYQAGTLSGNPLAMSAGIATIEYLKNNPNLYQDLEALGNFLASGLIEVFSANNISVDCKSIGGLFGLKFTQDKDTVIFNKFFKHMLDKGIYLPPSAFEAMFLSICHTKSDMEYFISSAAEFNK